MLIALVSVMCLVCLLLAGLVLGMMQCPTCGHSVLRHQNALLTPQPCQRCGCVPRPIDLPLATPLTPEVTSGGGPARPGEDPARHASPGRVAVCPGCAQRISASQASYEVEIQGVGELRFHLGCFEGWAAELRRRPVRST